MILKLQRTEFTSTSTIGKLFVDGKFQCYTLEDCDRHLNEAMPLQEIVLKKMYGNTAIPYGTYEVIINMSTRFKRLMPLLLDVKGFSGIRIHSGNTTEDTLGCILLGKSKENNKVLQSRDALIEFMPLLEHELQNGRDVMITIG